MGQGVPAGRHGVLRRRRRIHRKRHPRLPQRGRAVPRARRVALSARGDGLAHVLRRAPRAVLRLLLRQDAGAGRAPERRPSQAGRAGGRGRLPSGHHAEHRRAAPGRGQPKRAGAARQRAPEPLHGVRAPLRRAPDAGGARGGGRRRAAVRVRRHHQARRGALRGAAGPCGDGGGRLRSTRRPGCCSASAGSTWPSSTATPRPATPWPTWCCTRASARCWAQCRATRERTVWSCRISWCCRA